MRGVLAGMHAPARSFFAAALPVLPLLAIYAVLTLVVGIALAAATRSYWPEQGWICGCTAMVAILISQAGFLSFWAVWGPQPPLKRAVISLVATLALYLELLITLLVSMESSADDVKSLFSALFVPLAFFSLQTPQWMLKFAIGAKMVHRAQAAAADAGARRFTLAQLLGATAAVAVSLAAARQGITLLDSGGAPEETMVIVALAYSGVPAGIGLLLCVPCTWAVLIASDTFRAVAALTGYGAFLCLALCMAAFASVNFRVGPAGVGWTLLFAIALVGCSLLGLSVSLAEIRSAGYRICKVAKNSQAQHSA